MWVPSRICVPRAAAFKPAASCLARVALQHPLGVPEWLSEFP